MASHANADLELLLEHDAWIRRLARRLVADRHQADDLAQDTWLSALSAGKAGRGRAFLAGVLKKRALQLRRSEGRRRSREARVEAREATPSAEETLERAELGRELARFVVELEEPVRSAVLLRYFENLPVRAIAERLDVPRKTVESRLSRGQALLAERWERRHPDDGRAWLALCAGPWTDGAEGLPLASSPSTLGALVNTKLALTAAAVLVAGGLAWFASTGSDVARDTIGAPADEVGSIEGAERDTLLVGSSGESGGAAPEEARSAVTQRTAEAPDAKVVTPVEEAVVAEAASPPITGQVVDPQGRPLSAIAVRFSVRGEEQARTVTDALGNFELPAPSTTGQVSTADDAFVDLYAQEVRAKNRTPLLLVAAAYRPLSGIVVDALGEPVEGARVALELPEGFAARFDAVLDTADDRVWETASDAEGRFALDDVPVVVDSMLGARLDGYEPALVEPPDGAGEGIELVLERPQSDENTLAGRVSDADGAPIAGAWVSLGARAVRSAADGTFQIERTDAMDADLLVAVHAGHRPAREQAGVDRSSGEPVWPAWIELVLGEPPLELAGVIVDEEGRPRTGMRMWLDDPTEFGVVGEDLTVQLENLSVPANSTYDESSDDYFRWTPTDDVGRFRIQGLDDREYRIGVLDTEAAQTRVFGPFEAGQDDLRLEFPRGERRKVRGRIVSGRGTPVDGVRVALNCPMFGGVHHRHGEELTDSHGRFAFENVAGEELSLWIRGEQVVPRIHRIEWEQGEEGVVTVETLCHFKVELASDSGLADGLRVLDADGNQLALRRIGATGYLTRSSWELVDGRSITLGVPDVADTLVLTKGGVEVRRVPLVLEPGRLELVTL